MTAAPGPRPLRVLVVDDSPLQRKILSSSLLRQGYVVDVAACGQEALAMCEAHAPDLVLSDWMMPGMDGLEFCKKFRAMQRESYGYFILLTSKSDKDAVARGLDTGADDFLTKPVNADELRARITAGERILAMQRQLSDQNRVISRTLAELQGLYDALDNDLIEARKLQQSLVRERFRRFGAADLSLLLRPSGHVGGDLVGFFPVGKTRLGIFAIDVSGHGISSALMTARLAGYLSATTPDQNVALRETADGSHEMLPPDAVIARLNRLVLEEMETEHYFTMLLAEVDLVSGRVSLAQAGHPHPLVQRADGRVELVGQGGLPVGLIEDAAFERFEIVLNKGDRLLLYSDGITECPDAGGGFFEEEGLIALAGKLHHLAGREFLEAMVWHLAENTGTEEFPDDISAALLEF
ncbi:PP2C family protein-serine/threonine phosphatase [Marinovum sp.]|uniref:PP2C family protein-serine/threonine phosphatase n=1 Tax=Marinovum sp. TaxID=2024839 RepID=UPI002B2675D2|nr:SpoIIE family protein phosphatase [Marinovum sp.]